MADDGSILHATEDVVGLAIFAGLAGLAINGVKKITKSIKKDKNDIEWF